MTKLDLTFIVPGSNENRWSDLLATLVATDPLPLVELLGVEFDAVRREVAVSNQSRRSDRLDLQLIRGGTAVVAIEVKVLSDLGPRQLARYSTAFPDAESYRVLHLARLPVNLRDAEPWESLTWEMVLQAYARSDNGWVAATARAWTRQLNTLVPDIGPATVWNDVPDDAAGFELALRARIAWLSSQLGAWCELEHDIVPSSGGGAWAVRMWTRSSSPSHYVTAELQEGLSAVAWKADPAQPYRERLPGPVVLLGMRQDGYDTSANFDWLTLHRMFANHVVDEDGNPNDGRAWHLTAARPRDPIDKKNWQGIVQSGAPRWLGKGWGMQVARSTSTCLFGARFGLRPDSTLSDVDSEFRRLQPLIHQMASS